MRLDAEQLPDRDNPSAVLSNGLLLVQADPGQVGPYTASIDNGADANGNAVVKVTENRTAVTSFPAAAVQSVTVVGSLTQVNVIQSNVALPTTEFGGLYGDTLFGGSGRNTLVPGPGDDVVYAILPTAANTIATADKGHDTVFTNAGALVVGDTFGPARDTVVRFFDVSRLPGSGFVGQAADGALYVTPLDGGGSTRIDDGAGGLTTVTYDFNDGNGPQVRTFRNVTAVAYFGGQGADAYLNNTSLPEAAYGGLGNAPDVLVGGFGVSVLKGLGGNDTLVGRSSVYQDLSGNAGADTLIYLGQSPRPVVFRVDANDVVVGADNYAVFISP